MSRAAAVVMVFAFAACAAKPEPPPAPAPESPRPEASAKPASGTTPAPTDGARVVTLDPALVSAGRVKLATADRRTPRGRIHLPGEVVPAEGAQAEVTTLVAGRVASLDVSEGERVAKGRVLATIDAPEIARAAADVLRARSRAVLTERKLARQLELDRQKATSQNAVDEARADDASARADLVAARTLLRSLGGVEPAKDVSADAVAPVRVALRAPIDGVVVKRAAILGGPVTPDRVLFRIVAPERVVVVAKQPETLGAAIAEGSRAQVRPRAGAGAKRDACTGKVERNYGAVDDARTVPLRIALDGACPGLSAGGFADVVLGDAPRAEDAGAGEALVVPRDAVVDVRGAPVVFVEQTAGRFVAAPVRLGLAADEDVVVEDGLAPGARIVVDGALLLKGELLRAELGGE